MLKSTDKKLDAIAKKLPHGTPNEKREAAKEINLLAKLLIDMKEKSDECPDLHSRFDG